MPEFLWEQIDSLYLHVRFVYPYAPTAPTVREVFRRSWSPGTPPVASTHRAWLRRIARSVVHGSGSDGTWISQRNRDAIVMDLIDLVDSLDAADSSQVVAALHSLTPSDVELLRMTTLEDLNDIEVGEILAIGAAEARFRLAAARKRYGLPLALRSPATKDEFDDRV